MNWVWKSKQRVQVNHSMLQQDQDAREKNLKRASLQPIYKPSQRPEMRSTAGSGEKEEAAGKTILSGGRERGHFSLHAINQSVPSATVQTQMADF